MPAELFANLPQTSVTSGGTTAPAQGTQETWTVASSSAFPAASSTATPPTQFHVADQATGKTGEIIAVTNVSGTTWTVTRGAESTTPVAHSPNFIVYQVVTAAGLGGMLQSANNLSDVASAASARANLGLATPVTIANGGTGQVTAAAALSALGGAAVAGDIGGTSASPQVTATHLSAALPVAQGGTGSATAAAALTALGAVPLSGAVTMTGNLGVPLKTVTTTNTTVTSDCITLCNASGGAFTNTLPDATAALPGAPYVFKKTDATVNEVTLNPVNSQTVDGATYYVLAAANATVTLRSDGSNWWVF